MTCEQTAAKLMETYEGVTSAVRLRGPSMLGYEVWELDGLHGKVKVLVDSEANVLIKNQ